MELAAGPSSSSATPQKTLEIAINDFQKILTEEQRSSLAKIGAVRDAQAVMIFTAQLDRMNQLSKGCGIASRIISALQSVHSFSTVVDTFVSSHPEIAALVWGSIKLTMLIAVNVKSYFEGFSTVLMSFGSHCPRFAEYQALYPSSARLQTSLCDFHAAIVRCCKHLVEVTQRTWQQHLKKAVLKSFEQEFQPDVQEIQTLSKDIKQEITLAKAIVDSQEQKLQKLDRVASSKSRLSLQTFIPRAENELREIKQLQIQQAARISKKERQRLLEFLSSHDHLLPFKEACKKRQYDTAEWVCAAPEFERWYDGNGPCLLWCSGKIGAGKTILCSNVINHVLVQKSSTERVAFFFFNTHNPESLKAETAIRSIIRQLIDSMDAIKSVEEQLQKLNRAFFVKLNSWIGLLSHVIQLSTTVFIMIDGIDECDATERRALIASLSSLTAKTQRLKTFIFSRDSVHMDLKRNFTSMGHISMNCDGVVSDIQAYIDVSIQERVVTGELVCVTPGLLDEIIFALTEHADGMFLWVTFLIDELCSESCDADIRKALHSLPKSLEETFDRIVLRIQSQKNRTGLVQKILRWMVVAQRPLTLDELGQAVSINIGQTDWNPEHQVYGIRCIGSWSKNLIQVTDEEPPSVQLAHSSVRDYLTRANWPPGLIDFHVDTEKADRYAGQICVTFLHFGVFKTTLARRPQPVRVPPVALARTALSREPRIRRVSNLFTDIASRQRKAANDPDLRKAVSDSESGNGDDSEVSLQERHPFLTYATLYWLHHTTHFQKGEPIMLQLWYDILDGGSDLAYQPWKDALFRKRWLLRPEDKKGPVDYGWQQTEDFFGKRGVVRSDDIVRHKLNAKDSENQSSLSWVYNGMLIWSYEMHRYDLLQYASSKLRAVEKSDLRSLMQRAVYESNQVAIAALLESVIWPEDLLADWLYDACEFGDCKVAEQLLNAGARWKTNPSTKSRHALLAAASQGGHLEVVQLLLNDGVNVHASSSRTVMTPVYLACESGHSEVVRLLLGAEPNVSVPSFGKIAATELQIASEKGNLAMVQLLLNTGADVNQFGCRPIGSITALQSACRYSRFEVVKFLLRANADVNAPGAKWKGYTAIQAASLCGGVEIIELLLDAGANVNAPPSFYGGLTALQAASKSGNLDTVRLLLGANADVNAGACEVKGTMALLAAAGGGHLEIVSRLLDAGADINALHYTLREDDMVQEAAMAGDYEYLQRRLDSGAAPRYLKAFERLLDLDTARNGLGTLDRQTALQAAAAHGHDEVVQRLLDSGADVNAVGSTFLGYTALQAAAAHGHVEVVQRLLDAGADVDAVSSVYPRRTALRAAASHGYDEVVQRLLDSGADVDAVGSVYPGHTLLRAAAEHGHVEVVQRLLDSGVDVNAVGSIYPRVSALQTAAEHGHIEVVQRLLEACADVGSYDSKVDLARALILATKNDNLKMVQLLLGAKNPHTHGAIGEARKMGYSAIYKVLFKAATW